jgi:hypothetical protein
MKQEKDPDPYLWLMDPDPGGPKKNMRIAIIGINFFIYPDLDPGQTLKSQNFNMNYRTYNLSRFPV